MTKLRDVVLSILPESDRSGPDTEELFLMVDADQPDTDIHELITDLSELEAEGLVTFGTASGWRHT